KPRLLFCSFERRLDACFVVALSRKKTKKGNFVYQKEMPTVGVGEHQYLNPCLLEIVSQAKNPVNYLQHGCFQAQLYRKTTGLFSTPASEIRRSATSKKQEIPGNEPVVDLAMTACVPVLWVCGLGSRIRITVN